MEDRDKQNPSTGSESDISKSQSQQQPPTSQAQAGFGETATEQRSDVEGSSIDKKPTDEGEGFVGSEGETDTSSELVEDEDKKFKKDDQPAPEGK